MHAASIEARRDMLARFEVTPPQILVGSA